MNPTPKTTDQALILRSFGAFHALSATQFLLMGDAPPFATKISPAGTAVLVFTIAFTIAGAVFVPTLVRPTSSRETRWLSVICLSCISVLSAFLACFGAFNGTALNGRVENGHYFVGEHGYYTEVSPTIYTISEMLPFAALFSLLILMICHGRIESIQQNESSKNGA